MYYNHRQPLPKSGDHVGYGYCHTCGGTVEVVVEDLSFDHAFGTQHDYRAICSVCEEEVQDYDEDGDDR